MRLSHVYELFIAHRLELMFGMADSLHGSVPVAARDEEEEEEEEDEFLQRGHNNSGGKVLRRGGGRG